MSRSKIDRRICDVCGDVAEVDHNNPKIGGLTPYRGWFSLKYESRHWMKPSLSADLCSRKCLNKWLKENSVNIID